MSVTRAVHAWLAGVAKHVGFDECVSAAVESLLRGLHLVYFGCKKCGALHLDTGKFAGKFAGKLHAQHVC